MYVRLHLPCIYILLHLIIIIVINHPCKTSSYFVTEKSSSYCIIINHHSKLLVQLSYHFLILRPMYTIIPVYEGCGSLWPWHWNVASAMPDRQLTLTRCTQRSCWWNTTFWHNLPQWFRLHPSIGTKLSFFLSWGQNTPLYMCPHFINIHNISCTLLCTSHS